MTHIIVSLDLLQVILSCAVVILLAGLIAWLAYDRGWRDAYRRVERDDLQQEAQEKLAREARRLAELSEAEEVARAAFLRAVNSIDGLRPRLLRVSETADELVGYVRAGEAAGMVMPVWLQAGDVPRGVRPEGRRASPAAAEWRALYRAFNAFLAVETNDERSLGQSASAIERIGAAAAEIAKATAVNETDREERICGFCSRPVKDTHVSIPGAGVWICDTCIVNCVRILEDRVGPDWRDAAG